MDILALLERQLTFIERFYNRTVEPFENIHRKIRDGEEPFIPASAGEDDEEPEYLDEWLEADEIAEVLGQCALGLLVNAFHNHLRGFAKRYFDAHVAGTFEFYYKTFEGTGWFPKFDFFLKEVGFVWADSPVSRDKLEQLVLTRNDITHDQTIHNASPSRTDKHAKKYPVPLFADEIEVQALAGWKQPKVPVYPILIKVTREKLLGSIEDVRQFCGYLEATRTRWAG